jgi:hypothetical protein
MSDTERSIGTGWPEPLWAFDHPPLTETMMAVHFSPVRELDSIAVLDFWRNNSSTTIP